MAGVVACSAPPSRGSSRFPVAWWELRQERFQLGGGGKLDLLAMEGDHLLVGCASASDLAQISPDLSQPTFSFSTAAAVVGVLTP